MQLHYHIHILIFHYPFHHSVEVANMTIAVLETESTLTDRYQTTVPEPVRQALKLGKRDKVHYSILDNGDVLIRRSNPVELADPVMERFLDFLTKDLQAHPERLQAIDAAWVKRLQAVIKNTAIDLDAPLPNDGD